MNAIKIAYFSLLLSSKPNHTFWLKLTRSLGIGLRKYPPNSASVLGQGVHGIRLSSYKTAILKKYDTPLQIEECQRKVLKDGENIFPSISRSNAKVRVAVHACGVNASDLLMVENKYDHKISLPFTPGFEICGEVLEVGKSVNILTVGQRVLGLSKRNLGGFAEECILAQEDVWPLDMSVSFARGASLAENYATSLLCLHKRGDICSSSTVLITASAGGLGLAAVDLATNVYKAKVIGVCDTEDNTDVIRDTGAWAAVKYNKKHLQKKVIEVTQGKGVNIVFDCVGGEIFADALQCVCNEGRVLVAGFSSRVIPPINANELLDKAASVIGVSLTSYRTINMDIYKQAVQDVIEMHEMGLIKPYISATFKLEETKEAFECIREKKSTGKVILEVR